MKHRNLEKCNKCGICNLDCPAYLAARDETLSPRNMVKLAAEGKMSPLFYSCMLGDCDCFKNCPVGVKIDIVSIREALVKEGKSTEANEQMRASFLKHGNPFGDPEKAKVIKKYYT